MNADYTIWIDVEDIFQYFENNSRPSGIQRLVYEILHVIRKQAATKPGIGNIALIRRGQDETQLFSSVSFDDLEDLFVIRADEKVTQDSRPPPRARTTPRAFVRHLRHTVIRRIESLPPELARPLLTIAVNQLRALRLLRRFVQKQLKRAPRSAPQATTGVVHSPTTSTAALPKPGDIFLILGAAWSEPGFGERLARMRKAYGIQPVLLLSDLIPAIRPEWCALSLIRDFKHWLDTTLPQCGRLLAISHATAKTIEDYTRKHRLKLLAPVQTVPIGSGFGPPRKIEGERPKGLPAPDSYVLFVSTIEARKNHILAFRIWRRLVADLPPEQVPTLVFAGRVGWLVSDLMQQLENTEWLRGKIRLLRDPSDDELAHLYDGCMFTLFPSLFEGWGLPVTESLVNGRPCVASNSTSIPEAGGPLSRYFDPENTDEAYRVVRETIEDREGLKMWQEEVRTQFKPTPWEHTADAILDACHAAYVDGRAS
ncbi:glycosyltransferase family 4 protein [Gluconobacter sp. Dm-62]|uniref:glycosyltransferase family 4 protein n=1 Tax=Gluconobacter sp. Dm-62 TaxID=2799804 RepID=UPI001B8D922D|nr:glycosyltransferase family 1 protein [Gluconobacter sp. Dm-62]MBS1104166.1 glycosyltransferase family 4 protein [Gluconobacter sp. Dm-62]